MRIFPGTLTPVQAMPRRCRTIPRRKTRGARQHRQRRRAVGVVRSRVESDGGDRQRAGRGRGRRSAGAGSDAGRRRRRGVRPSRAAVAPPAARRQVCQACWRGALDAEGGNAPASGGAAGSKARRTAAKPRSTRSRARPDASNEYTDPTARADSGAPLNQQTSSAKGSDAGADGSFGSIRLARSRRAGGWGVGRPRSIEQRPGARRQQVGVARGRQLTVAARDRREVRIPHLDRHRSADERLPFEPRRVIARHLVDCGPDLAEVGEVLRERVFVAAGFCGAVWHDRPIVNPGGELAQPLGLAASASRSAASSAARTSIRRSMPRSRNRPAVTGPTPHSASTGSFWRKCSTRSGGMTVRPSGFFHADAIFARNLLGATPADAVNPIASQIWSFSRCATTRPRVSPHAFSVTSR